MREGRWFGTPVGAALLVGALAGGVSMIESCLASMQICGSYGYSPFGSALVRLCSAFLHYTLLLTAPAICLRSGRRLLQAVGVGFVCLVPAMAHHFVCYLAVVQFSPDSVIYVTLMSSVAASLVANALLGYVTARLYELPMLRWRCLLVALACCLANMGLSMGSWCLIPRVDSESIRGETFQTLQMSLVTIMSFIQVVPIAYVIERHQARMYSRDVGRESTD